MWCFNDVRLELLDKLKKYQSKQLDNMSEIYQDITKTSAAVQQKLEKVINIHLMLSKRAEDVLRIISSHQEKLSPAEKQFHKELREMKDQIPNYQNKIKQVKGRFIYNY